MNGEICSLFHFEALEMLSTIHLAKQMPKKIIRTSRAKHQPSNVAALREDAPEYRVNCSGIGHRKSLTVLDTFAGAGGFSLGFELAGCRVLGGIEIDSWASETFAHNHKDSLVVTRDIQSVSDDELCDLFAKRRPNILLGGPPCQGFSICRKNAGDPTDPRNSLFVDFLRFARVLQPDYVIMENVPNIENARTHIPVSSCPTRSPIKSSPNSICGRTKTATK